MAEALIRDVSDTAYWVAYLRALESKRSDALFRDPLAQRLAGARGRRIAQAMPTGQLIGWTIVIRTCIIDDIIQRAVAEGVDTVLNLGAGLDTRPYRLELPESLQWIEADYAKIVEIKETRLAPESPRCRLERVKIDLAQRALRRELLARVNDQSARMLILTEGVMPYLSIEEGGELADDLRALSHARYWLLDYFSPEASRFRRRKEMQRRMRNAPFRFELDDWFGFFSQRGWQPAQTRYLVEEAERLGRPIPLPWFVQAAMGFWGMFASKDGQAVLRKFAAYVLMEPG